MKFSSIKALLISFGKTKIAKLGLLGATLVAFLLSSGYSFAKYYTENTNNGNAGAAKFNVSLTNNTKFVYLPDDLSNYQTGFYSFASEFCVDFSACEVKTQFDLYLKLCGEYSTDYDNPNSLSKKLTYFTLPYSTNAIYTIEGEVNSEEQTLITKDVPSKLTDGKHTNFSKGTLYYGYSQNGTTYNWTPSFDITANSQEIIIKGISSNALSKHYLKVIYFTYVSITSSSEGNNTGITYTASFENSIILSKLAIEQVV